VKGFEAAISEFGRIDYVYPIAGIGERPWTPHHTGPKDAFVKPDLCVADVDMRAVLYSCSLALQQFRRQEPDKDGFRGKSNALPSPPSRVKKLTGAVSKSAAWPPFAGSIVYRRCLYTQPQNSELLPPLSSRVNAHSPFQWYCRVCTEFRKICESLSQDPQRSADPSHSYQKSK
jgi:hypothetical protein